MRMVLPLLSRIIETRRADVAACFLFKIVSMTLEFINQIYLFPLPNHPAHIFPYNTLLYIFSISLFLFVSYILRVLIPR